MLCIVSGNGTKGAKESNVLFEVSAAAMVRLVKEGRVYVKWYVFKVLELESVLKCFQCHRYGHMMRKSTNKKRVCMKCVECGHEKIACKNEKDVCRNCKLRDKQSEYESEYESEYMRLL